MEAGGRGLVCSDSGLGEKLRLALPGTVKGRFQLGGWGSVCKDAFPPYWQAGDEFQAVSLLISLQN